MNLSEARKAKGLSAGQMASWMGITPKELLEIEEGKRTPRLCLAQKWANALGLSFEEFSRYYYEKADPAQAAYYDSCLEE